MMFAPPVSISVFVVKADAMVMEAISINVVSVMVMIRLAETATIFSTVRKLRINVEFVVAMTAHAPIAKAF